MRNTTLSLVVSGLVVGALAGSAHADHRGPAAKVALIEAPRMTRAQLTGELAITAPAASAVAAPARPARLPASLEAGDVTAQIAPHASDIERCYLTHVTGSAGHLDVLFEIGRDGRVRSVATAAGSLSPRATQQVTSCIRALAEGVQFPARRNDTTVVLPYYFQKTEAPGAGPQLSCWSPKGCR